MQLPRRTSLVVALAVAHTAHAQAGVPAYGAEARASHIYVVTHRAGVLSFLGHEHAILAPSWSARLCDEHAADRSSVAIVVDATRLVINSDSARSLAGLRGGPSAGQLQTIRAKLPDARHLDVARHGALRFESSQVASTAPDALRVRGTLTIRGVSRAVELPLHLERGRWGEVVFSGTLVVRQSSFGITPETVAGVVRVADPVDIHVRLQARPSGESCQPGQR